MCVANLTNSTDCLYAPESKAIALHQVHHRPLIASRPALSTDMLIVHVIILQSMLGAGSCAARWSLWTGT
jgi:hypothetical protein